MSDAARIMVEPVRKSVTVKARPERAFDIFFARMGEWWIKSHSLTDSGQVSVTVEPRVGGAAGLRPARPAKNATGERS